MEQPPATAGIVMANWYWKVVRQFVSERFGISLSRSSCLNWLHRLGFAFKRPKKRLLKADESKRETFVAEYAVLWEEAQRTGARIFFADECPASTIFAGWRQSVLPVHLLGVAPLLGCVGAVAGDVKLQDDGVMDHPVDCRGGGHGVGEDAFPLREDQV